MPNKFSHLESQMLKKMDPSWDWSREHIMLHLPFYHGFGGGAWNGLGGVGTLRGTYSAHPAFGQLFEKVASILH